jgi:AcrR family transcriptional regulator
MAEVLGARTGRHRDPVETQERLLDAAERLLAERGYEGTSLRAVTQAAGTSVSAAHYHFGSKEALLRATLLRRVEPVNRRRLERLDALRREAGDRPVALEALLDAFLRPFFEERSAGRRDPARFVAMRLYMDPPEVVAAMKRELFGEVSARFLDALARSLPDRSRDELALALQFVVGIMVHVGAGHLEDAPACEGLSASPGGPLSDAFLLGHLTRFVAAGLRAPGPRSA